MQRRLAILIALSFFMSACSSSGDPKSTTTLNVAGNWQVSLANSAYPNTVIAESGSLVQSADNVSGSLMVSDSSCSGTGAVQGSVSGSTVSFAVSPVGSQINLTGTTVAPTAATTGSTGTGTGPTCMTGQTCMGGTYTSLSTGCTDKQTVPSSGTWLAILVTPLNGNISATLTANSGATYTVTGTIKQGANTGGSTTPLSGTLNFSAPFCYSSANIEGLISGTSVAINLVESDGTQVGQLTGTSSFDGTMITPASLQYLGLGKGAAHGCESGGAFNNQTFTIGAS